MHKISLLLTSFVMPFVSLLILPSIASAASPDGLGPWADTVVNFSQGNTKAGGAIPILRSDPTAALGQAEDDTTEGNFVSLGFGGQLILGFDNGISNGVISVEATNVGYPTETATIELSANGTTWFNAGTVSQDGNVDMPDGLDCARYVRITDTSNPANFSDETADGYDVDGVQAKGESCTLPSPTPKPSTPPQADDCKITQQNHNVFTNVINIFSNTGNNEVEDNTVNGSKTITTGKVKSKVSVSNQGGVNVIDSTSCCSQESDTKITIKNNGSNSVNKVTINNSKKSKFKL